METVDFIYTHGALHKREAKRDGQEDGEMALWLRALTALPKVLSSTPDNHKVDHNHLSWDLMPSSGVSEDSYSVLT